MGLPMVLGFAHQLIQERISTGEKVIDATAGNGIDTLFLAKCVGAKGQVYAIDIQQEALHKTRARLSRSTIAASSVQFIHCSHEQMRNKLPLEIVGQIGAVMFNLGYLPGGDHTVITRADTTVNALQTAVTLLRSGGIITIVIYTGHDGAREEAFAVDEWAKRLPQKQFQVISYRHLNQQNNPPYIIAVEKS